MQVKKFNSYEEARAYVNNLPIQAVLEGYATLLVESQGNKIEPIRITQRQLDTYFKVIGLTQDGNIERRGRKRKEL